MWKKEARSLLNYLYDKLDEIEDAIDLLEEAIHKDNEELFRQIDQKISED